MSAEGRVIAFGSRATNLVADDTNGHFDLFVRDLGRGTTTRARVSSAGRQANGDWLPVGEETLATSSSGRYVAFISLAGNLVAGDTNRNADVFVRDLRRGRTTRMSLSSAG